MARCRCGSGEEQYALNDAAGIFLTYVCDGCVEEKKHGYNPAIFYPNSSYAQSGEESDIGRDDEFDMSEEQAARDIVDYGYDEALERMPETER
jgi:hypothetical protein